MTGTGHALQVALSVMVIGAVGISLAIASISFGLSAGNDAYRITKQIVKSRVRCARLWYEYRSLRWDARRELTVDYFKPWVDEEARRREHPS